MALRSSFGPSLVAMSAPLLASCAAGSGTPIVMHDPLALIEDADEVRLILMSGATHACLPGGVIAPDVPDVPLNMVPDAIADFSISRTDPRQDVSVPEGDYIAFVRVKGADPVSGVRNTIIGRACTEILGVAPNETRSVMMTVVPVTVEGVCSDAILSPDEQCSTPGVGDCNATCQTTSFQLNTTNATGAQEGPRSGGRGSNRIATTFVNERLDLGVRLLGPDGQPLSSPATLTQDLSLNDWLMSNFAARLPGTPVTAQVAVAPTGRVAIAAALVPRASEFDVRVGFFDTSFVPEGDFVAITDDTGRQDAVSGAFAGDGSYLAAFVDGASGGVSVRAFAAGSRTPTGGASVSIATGGTTPVVAGLATGFAVAYEASGRVMIQRVDGTGAMMGAAIAASDGGGAQSQPAIAGLASGGFVVAYRDASIDANGTGIGGRVFDASGVGMSTFQVNSTAGGDQSTPSVAAHEDRIAIAFETGGAIHARFFTTTGGEALNREPTQSFDEFEIAPAGTEPTVVASGAGTSALWFFSYRTLTDGLGDVYGRRIPR